MTTQQSDKHMAFVCCVRFHLARADMCVGGVIQEEHNSVQGLPSPPNQTLLLFIPEGTKETNPLSQPDSLHSC